MFADLHIHVGSWSQLAGKEVMMMMMIVVMLVMMMMMIVVMLVMMMMWYPSLSPTSASASTSASSRLCRLSSCNAPSCPLFTLMPRKKRQRRSDVRLDLLLLCLHDI